MTSPGPLVHPGGPGGGSAAGGVGCLVALLTAVAGPAWPVASISY